VTIAYHTHEEWGPHIFGEYVFGNITVSSNSFARSGRPYTPSTNTKLTNGARTPAEYNTNMKLTKKVTGFFGTAATFYAEIFNVFENRILNYAYLFPKVNAGQSNNLIEAYDTMPLNDKANGVLYWNESNRGTGFPVDQSFLIYDNGPRSFNFGMLLEL
jgi:hypothetical protein